MRGGFTLAQSFGHGRTFQNTILGVQPAAGANFALTLQPYDYWRLIAATFTLTTSATSGNRYVTVTYSGVGPQIRTADGAAVLVTESTTAQRFIGSLNRGVSEWNTGTDVFFPLSGLWLQGGSILSINVGNIKTADQIASITLTFDCTTVPQDGSEDYEREPLERPLRRPDRG